VAADRTGRVPPARSREQRRRGLEQANEIRSARATLKKQLAAGTIELAPIIASPPAWLQTARVRNLLLAVPKIGTVKASRLLTQCGIAHSKTLGGLSDRQRHELINILRR
jgi:hypothetical protein